MDRNESASNFFDTVFPLIFLSEVAVFSGTLLFALIPIPDATDETTVKSVVISQRMPAIFFVPAKTSLGHFIEVSIPETP